MTATDSAFTGSIPALYDRYLGPLLFAPYAADLVTRIAKQNPKNILETAAGTGILAIALARALPQSVAITATDLNKPMIDFAAAKSGAGRIAFRQADAMNLPFPDQTYDTVACQFGAMFFPERVTAYAEARRVLQPGGRFIFNVWDRLEENEFAHAVTGAVARLFPDNPPRFLERMPHGYHDTGKVRADLAAAGFGRIDIATVTVHSRAPSPRDVATGYCQGTPLRLEIEARDASRLGEATDAATAALAARFGEGPVEGKAQAFVITAAG